MRNLGSRVRSGGKALLLGTALLAGMAGMGGAREEIPAESRIYGYSANLPACDSPGILGTIEGRFHSTEAGFWNSDARIAMIQQVRTLAFRPHGLDLIPRRYCQAVAVMADQRRLKLNYAIVEDYGLIGAFNDVHFCLEGYDRNHTASPACSRFDR